MNRMLKEVFENKEWSTASVADATLQDFRSKNFSYYLLNELTDVDEEKDLPKSWLPN